MTDECTNVASQEEISICAQFFYENQVVEHFFGIIHAKESNAKAILECLAGFV